MKEIMSETEASEFMGVSKQTFRRMVEQGVIPFSALQTADNTEARKKKFFLRSRLIETLEANEVQSGS